MQQPRYHHVSFWPWGVILLTLANGTVWLQLISGLLIIGGMHRLYGWLDRRVNGAWPPLVFALGVGLLRGLGLQWGFPHFTGALARTIEWSGQNMAVGQLLIDTVLGSWLMVLFYRTYAFKASISLSRRGSFAFAFLAILPVGGMLFGLTFLMGAVAQSPDLQLNFDNVLQIGGDGIAAVLSLLFCGIGIHLFAIRMLQFIRRSGLGKNARLGVYALGLLGLWGGLWVSGLPVAGWQMVLTVLLYLLLLDLFQDSGSPNLTWVMVWSVFFAGYLTVWLYQHHLEGVLAADRRAARELLEGLQSGEDVLARLSKSGKANSHRLYRNLLSDKQKADKKVLADVQYRITRNGRLVARRGSIKEDWPAAGGGALQESLHSTRHDLRLGGDSGWEITLRRPLGGYANGLSLFSFLFALAFGLLLLLFALNRFLSILPLRLDLPLLGPDSLGNRLQLALLGLILGAFLVIGLVTTGFIRNSFLRNQEAQIRESMQSVLTDMREETRRLSGDSARQHLIRRLPAFAEIHGIDMDVFDSAGERLATTAPDTLSNVMPPVRMNNDALAALKNQGRPVWLEQREAGELTYRTATFPLRTSADQPGAFIAMPFPRQEALLRQDIEGFLGNLLNVYVFLLLAAGGTAIGVANSITVPIERVAERLRTLDPERNEPLAWSRDDEIGALIHQYNRAIRQLEERTNQLRVSEREGAWREMAKQVAHEIKNPLTPMKLQIQYLMHAQRAQPERAGAMLPGVANTLIEQIESLSRIASEFSDFAKMPTAQNETFSLNELLQSLHRLYQSNDPQEPQVHLQLPEEDLSVYADPDQLRRVLTNLIRNGMQAVPDDRQGRIELRLYREGQWAFIKVRDNGSGIPEEVQPKVFQPNFTTKNSGMGLGLAMCKQIVEQAGGRIGFETRLGVGTVFWVGMPVC